MPGQEQQSLKSCPYCYDPNCHITKEQVLQRGPILERNAYAIMRDEYNGNPRTYAFDGVPAYDSLSALIPDADDENPHAYMRLRYDEDEDCVDGWECWEIDNPLSFPTEEEMLYKILNCVPAINEIYKELTRLEKESKVDENG